MATNSLSRCRAAAFAANNVGVELLRNGQFAKSLAAFQNAAVLLDPAKSDKTRMCTVRQDDRPSSWVIPWPSPSTGDLTMHLQQQQQQQPSMVHLVEYDELHDFRDTHYNTCAIRIGEISPEASKEGDFDDASVLYNYGLSCLMFYIQVSIGRETTVKASNLLQASKRLFESAREILFNEILFGRSLIREEEEDDDDDAMIPAFHLANFVLTGLTTIHRLQGHSLPPRDLQTAQKKIAQYLHETNLFVNYLRCSQVTSKAA